MSSVPARPRWRFLITPKWLGWHAFAVAATLGMLWLGDWQFHRAESGNALSWAYTFEWPVFAVFGLVFWAKTIRDEFNPPADPGDADAVELPDGRRPGPGRPDHHTGRGRARGLRRPGTGRLQRLPGPPERPGKRPRPMARPALAPAGPKTALTRASRK